MTAEPSQFDEIYVEDHVLVALSSERRRAILRHLRDERTGDSGRATSVDDVVAALERHDRSFASGTEPLTALVYHSDLPKLHDSGIVRFHPGEKSVEYCGDRAVGVLLDILAS